MSLLRMKAAVKLCRLLLIGESRRMGQTLSLHGTFFVLAMVCEKSTFSDDLILKCTSCQGKSHRGEI